MKNIFKLSLFVFALALSVDASAQVRTTTRSTINEGTYLDYPGSQTAAATFTSADTLQVSDTVAYILPITHLHNVDLFHQWYWSKSGSATATITLTFYQSNDPYNFTTGSQLTSGVAKTAYTKTYSLSASGWNYVDLKADSVVFNGRYLKVQYMTSSTASVGGKVFSRTKTNIR